MAQVASWEAELAREAEALRTMLTLGGARIVDPAPRIPVAFRLDGPASAA